jgi:hypothetical protein
VVAALEVTEGEELRLTTSGGGVVRVAVADLPAPGEKAVAPIAEIGAERVVGCSRALAAGRTEIPEESAPANIAAGEAGELDLFTG